MEISKVKVKEAMERSNLSTYKELAAQMGITNNQLSVILSGKYDPFKSGYRKLTETLDIDPIQLLDIKETTNKVMQIDKFCNFDNVVTGIELFAGAGGLALGLEKAGIKDLAFVEFNDACCATLKHNRPEWNVIHDDIHNVNFKKYKNQIDIVSGGAPCQAFSYAGKKLGFNDTRGTLFYEFARCIKETHPKMFLFENVRGLLSHDKGRTIETIKSVLSNLNEGYVIQQNVLNAAYYGVGQKRERVILIGIRKDLSEDIHFTYPEPDKNMTTLRTALKNCPISEGEEYSERKKKVLDLVPPGGCWVNLPENIAKEYMGKSYYSGGGRRGMARRISWDEPCLTLTCSPSQMQTERCHPDQTRPFTVREYARIQSFDDDWNFSGSMGDQYKQIGNAVPVKLAKRIGEEIVKSICTYKNLTKKAQSRKA